MKLNEIDINMKLSDQSDKDLVFKDALSEEFLVRGFAFFDEERVWDRLGKRKSILQSVNEGAAYLATNTAGGQIHFETDSAKVQVYVRLNAKSNMVHMAATGQCGVDCYIYDENAKDFVFRCCSTYDISKDSYAYTVYDAEKKNNKFILNLPLYMGVKDIFIGVQKDSVVKEGHFYGDGRIVVYGTSIVQGGCASRPGMAHTNILSRTLKTEVVNMGFSGVAFCEREMGEICGSISKQKLLIIDAEPNAGINEVLENNLETFVCEYRKRQPHTPILLISRMPFAMDLYDEYRRNLKDYYKKFLKQFAGTHENVYFSDSETYFSDNVYEYTVDGIHPTDYGFVAIAKGYEGAIKKILR